MWIWDYSYYSCLVQDKPPQAITRVLAPQTKKELEYSLEEKKNEAPSILQLQQLNFTYYLFIQITRWRNCTYLYF